MNNGYKWVVDLDLEKFFDTVNQDLLISIIRRTINEDKVVSIIRKYLQAGVLVNGVFERTEKGTPQGGNISPILSNIMLNELDKELEKRSLQFVRYADDCVIFTKSKKSAECICQVMDHFIIEKRTTFSTIKFTYFYYFSKKQFLHIYDLHLLRGLIYVLYMLVYPPLLQ